MRTPERLLDGRYRIVRRLGSGGMATVFLAEDERLGRRVAVKRLHGDVSDEDLVKRFQREARLGASLNHPNVVAVYDIAADQEGVLIVMEYVDGRTLRDEIATGPLPAERALPILRGVAEALDHAHGLGVLHRDVKPANVLLRSDGAVKLADLGIATAAEHSKITRSGSVLGTAAYMAPERLDGAAGDHRVDVYALASVAFEALAGRKAIEGATPLEVARRVVSQPPPDLRDSLPGAPPAAAEVLRRGLAKDPEARPASACELVADLTDAFSEPVAKPTPVPAAKPTPAPPAAPAPVLPARGTGSRNDEIVDTTRPSPRRWRVRALAAVVLVGALVALGAAISGGSDQEKATKGTQAKAARKKHRGGAARSARAPDQGTAAPAATGSPAPAGSPAATGSPAPAGSPAATVDDFYRRAARHEYQGAWSLVTPNGQSQLGGFASFARGQSTLRSISFPVLTTRGQTADTASVELRSNAIHANRVDHVCGTVGLVRSGSRWLLDAFHLDTCRSANGTG